MLALILSACLATPAPAPKGPPLPDLHGKSTQFGPIEQKRDQITIIGPHWTGIGEVKKDQVRITWVGKTSGRIAESVYKIEGDRLIGQYGYLDEEAVMDDNWILAGPCLCHETIYVSEPRPEMAEPEPGPEQ